MDKYILEGHFQKFERQNTSKRFYPSDLMERELEKLAELQKKIDTFNKAKEEAFQALRTAQDVETQALGTIWQTKEDNDYEI